MKTEQPDTLPMKDPLRLVAPEHTIESVTDKISSIVLTRPTPLSWWLAFAAASTLVVIFIYGVAAVLYLGVGLFGINIPVAWGFAITNFVWWIGIGHAGTLISAILLLMRQKWRNSINRFAEAMTIFAVMCAGIFPLIHLGRPWFFYWLLPYPSTMGIQPQFRSPLVWDVFAVSTYFTVSFLFWYQGLIPDLATLRDRSRKRVSRFFYGMLAMGWRGSARHWQRYEMAYLLLGGLATPLVVSVHTVVSFDFAVALVPGWHSTIFPPYFVAGAIYSGFSMVLTIAIPIRKVYGLEDLVTLRHIKNMAIVMLATGMVVTYSYLIETFMAWYSMDIFEHYMIWNRAFGPYGWLYWMLILFNLVIPQLLWSRRLQENVTAVFLIALSVNYGMWLERYIIIITALHRDFMPSAWGMFSGTLFDYFVFLGTIGLFLWLLMLFIRFMPMISIFEIRELVHELKEKQEQPV
jgi:molybdopterin-containing oxidoreductase family membrane subunit